MNTSRTLIEYTKEELEETLKNKQNIQFNYNDILGELNRRFEMEHNEALLEQTRRVTRYTFWMTLSTVASTVIAVIALLIAVFK